MARDSRIKGITIEIGGDTTKLQDSLKAVDKQLSSTKSELKDIDKLLRLDPGNTDLLRQKQERLGSAIKDTKTRLEELQKAQDQVDQGTKEWDALQREIVATGQELDDLKEKYNDFGSVAAQKIANVGQKLEDLGGKLQNAGNALKPISTAAAGALAGLGGLAYKSVTTADELNTLAKQTGFTTEEIQQMKYAADLVDVSFEDIEGALKKLKPQITADNKELAALGVSVKNVDGTTRDATDVFYDTIKALSKIPNETERDQRAMAIFGRSADSLAGIIDDGGAALRKYGKEAKDLGLIMEQDTVDSLNTVNDTIDKLKAQGGGALAKLGATIATAFAPSLEKIVVIVGKVTDFIAKLNPEQAELILKILAITAAISPLLTIGGKLISGIGAAIKLAPQIVTAIKLVSAALTPQTLLIAAIVAAVVALGVIIYKNWDKIKAWTKDMVNKVKDFFSDMKNSIANSVNSAKEKITSTWSNIQNSTIEAFEGVGRIVAEKLNAVKRSFEDNGGGLKGIAAATFTALKEYYKTGYDALNSITGGKLDTMKNSFLNTWESIKSSLRSKIEGIRTTVSTGMSNIVSKIKSIFDFNFTLPKLKIPSWSDLSAHFSSLVQSLKNAFKFDWSLPKIKLPHFKVHSGEAPYGLGGKGKLPSISIEWYKKAYDNPVLFTSPTVLQTSQGMKGFGDNGAEIVMGLNKLRELVGASGDVIVNVYGAPGQSVSELADLVVEKIVNVQMMKEASYA